MATFKLSTLAQMFSAQEMRLQEFAESKSLEEAWTQKAEIGEEYEKTHSLKIDALIMTTTVLLSGYREVTNILQEELNLLNEIKSEYEED